MFVIHYSDKPTMTVAESEDGWLFSTEQVYTPPVVTVRVCVYCAVSGLSNTVSVPSVTLVESLVQVTVVAGPPVEIQVRVSWSESNVTSFPIIVMLPMLCLQRIFCMDLLQYSNIFWIGHH